MNPFAWLLRGLTDLILPPCCHICEVAIADAATFFCPRCERALLGDMAPTCPRCAATLGAHLAPATDCSLCRGEHFAFSGVCRLGPYEEEMRSVVLRLKDRRQEALAEILGRCLAPRVQARWPGEGFTAVVPVPLHWWRRWRRGYNQSASLAHGVAEQIAVPCRTNWLQRVRNTVMQQALSPTARRQNVRDAFIVRSGVALAGATILLVDDILTTGATGNEAARALLAAGAEKVCVAVLARAGD